MISIDRHRQLACFSIYYMNGKEERGIYLLYVRRELSTVRHCEFFLVTTGYNVLMLIKTI